MNHPRIFCVKLQLHFGGDVHEINVPAYNGAEPTVLDLMNVIERDFRVPKALQTIVFTGQDLHQYPNEPLSRFGIKNLATIRLVGRMAPPNMINQINAELGMNNGRSGDSYYQQSSYGSNGYQQQPQSQIFSSNNGSSGCGLCYGNEPSSIKYYNQEQPYYQEHQQLKQDSTNEKPLTPKTPKPSTPAQGGPSMMTQSTQYDPPTEDEQQQQPQKQTE
ncbi:unnamed protein product [Didymodactylos carnosus]|uniref:Ubiquitin-like domain-containing protein n=1 Tax=Didymodactylos carnosus TaxID=1234261 RepID=A0A8S2NZL2_9BILA|nr:unnamed protein product [Didymodactylos carnosus]CAF4020844.1 unnamed protein product [Didymodactylos carnosus]